MYTNQQTLCCLNVISILLQHICVPLYCTCGCDCRQSNTSDVIRNSFVCGKLSAHFGGVKH
eukprot:UN05773